MSELKVYFRGLFTLVRHIAPPAAGARIPAGSELMTVVFPRDDHAGGHGHGHDSHSHSPALYFERNAIREATPGLLNSLGVQQLPDSEGGGFKMDIRQSTLFLPVSWDRQGVSHFDDEVVKADGSDVSSARVGPEPEKWMPLSRLANLNLLTGTPFAAKLDTADPRVHASVRLSGGSVRCLRSYKALADCFFEYCTAEKTIAVQPGVEEIEYTTLDVGEEVQIGLGPLGATEPSTTFPWDPKEPLIFESLPLGGPMPKDLSHFDNHYKLMAPPPDLNLTCVKQVPALPLIRVAARSHKGQIVYTMGGDDGICRMFPPALGYQGPSFRAGFRTESRTGPGPCSCLAAMAFLP